MVSWPWGRHAANVLPLLLSVSSATRALFSYLDGGSKRSSSSRRDCARRERGRHRVKLEQKRRREEAIGFFCSF